MRTKTSSERRFQSVESGANNVLFIRTSLERPEALVEKIVSGIAGGGEQRARYILRLVPILGTCKVE
jgi:tRNA acetyltransferase TAN1